MYCLKSAKKCSSFSKVSNNWKLNRIIGDHENIVIVNCNAGKGRTGTSIACFLMFSGLAENAVDGITYYGWKRFAHGRGVTQPS